MVLTLGSFFVSALGGFSLGEELEWYGRQGYNISELDYDLFVEYYEGYKLHVHEIDRKGVREQSNYVKDLYGEIDIFFDKEKNIIYFQAHLIKSKKEVLIFMWKASY
jgi:hypothetical protein